MKEILQFSPERRVRDLFLSEHGTMIRVYGFIHQTYILPVFLTLRVFSLELIRQRLIVEDEHFSSFKRTSEIKFPWTVGPFVVKRKSTLQMIESMLREMGFSVEVAVNYDPHHVISNRRQANKNKPFEHSEVEGLSEVANWMDYPRGVNDGENMQGDSLSSAPGMFSP